MNIMSIQILWSYYYRFESKTSQNRKMKTILKTLGKGSNTISTLGNTNKGHYLCIPKFWDRSTYSNGFYTASIQFIVFDD